MTTETHPGFDHKLQHKLDKANLRAEIARLKAEAADKDALIRQLVNALQVSADYMRIAPGDFYKKYPEASPFSSTLPYGRDFMDKLRDAALAAANPTIDKA